MTSPTQTRPAPDPQLSESPDLHRDGREGWSRRAFLTGTAMTLGSLVTPAADAF